MCSVADWNFMRIGIMHLWKVSSEPWCVNEFDTFLVSSSGKTSNLCGVAPKKKKKKWAWNCNYSQMTFPPVSSCRFWSSLSWQPSLYQVTCGQCSHCLFISVPASVRSFVHLSTSNPASGSFCPLQAQCQQPDFDVKPQFIRLSLRTPPAVHIMSGNQ